MIPLWRSRASGWGCERPGRPGKPLARSGAGSRYLLVLLACALSGPATSGGGNLLVNPNFDSDLAGWSDLFARWSHRNSEGAVSGPGSAECDASGSICQLTQCVPTSGEFVSVDMGAAFRNLAGAATQSFSLSALGFAGNDCTNSNAESISITTTAVGTGEWLRVEGRFFPTLPTASVRFGVNCGGATTQRCLADDVRVVLSNALFSDGFEDSQPGL